MKQTLQGVGLGILGNIVGFLLYGLAITLVQDVSFSYFYNNMFLGTDVFKSQVLTGSLLLNAILFYFIMRKGNDGLIRGIVLTILFTVMAIVYYYS